MRSSLKSVLPALVRGLGYDDLEIGEGGTAQAVLETLLLDGDSVPAAEMRKLRKQLMAYCERDTLGMVRLLERLEKLSA